MRIKYFCKLPSNVYQRLGFQHRSRWPVSPWAKREVGTPPLPTCPAHAYNRVRPRHKSNSLLLLLLKKVGSARLRESGIHPITPKTPAPQYQPIDRKNRNGKKKTIVGIEQLRPIKKHWPCSWNPPVPHHRIRGQQDRSRGTMLPPPPTKPITLP